MHWIESILKSKFAKFFLCTILVLIIFVVGVGIFTDKHIKLWIIEFNDEKSKNTITKDTTSVTDSYRKNTELKTDSAVNRTPTVINKRIKFLNKNNPEKQKSDTSKKNGQINVEFKAAVSGSPMQIGGTNNVQVNGIIPRKIDKNSGLIDAFLARKIPYTVNISFTVYGFADAEIHDVIRQITVILRSYGYNQIEDSPRVMIGYKQPEDIFFRYNMNENSVNFGVPVNQQK